jgi:hypothetical protein
MGMGTVDADVRNVAKHMQRRSASFMPSTEQMGEEENTELTIAIRLDVGATLAAQPARRTVGNTSDAGSAMVNCRLIA